MSSLIDVYIIHDISLTDRHLNVEKIKQLFKKNKQVANIFIVDEYDHKGMDRKQIISLLNTEEKKNKSKLEEQFAKFTKPLNVKNISNYMKHFKALEKISNSTTQNDALIIEDDVIISESFDELFDVEKLKDCEFDMIFFGQPFKERSEKTLVKIENWEGKVLLPTIESYFVKYGIVKSLVSEMIPIHFCTNVGLSYIINKLDINVAKMCPNLFVDGTKTGKFVSSINNNNICMFNNAYNKMYELIQSDKCDFEEFDKVFENSEYNTSPDIMYLKALYYLKNNKVELAKSQFDAVFEGYSKHNVTLDFTSSFMKNYINLYKTIQ
jgi:hypothetical protein